MRDSGKSGATRRTRSIPLALVLLALAASGCRQQEAAPLGRLAFVRGDTLYVQALPDGQARKLTVGRAVTAPRWSPTGEWLAFRRNDSLRLERSSGGIGGGGQTVAGAEATAFAWAPGDDRLAYVGGGNLVVARAGGMAVALVERRRDSAVEGVAWSPDGAWLAYGTQPPAGAGASARPGLWRIPARGGSPQALPLPAIPFVGAPLVRGWTPDGSRVLVLLPSGDLRTGTVASGGAALWAIPAAGGAPQKWADSVLPFPDFVVPAPVGAPGAGVAFVAGGGDATWRNKAIESVAGAAPAVRRLSPAGRAAISPAWSPDARRLAWVDMPEVLLAGGEDAAVGLQQRSVVVGEPGASPVPLGGPVGRQEVPRWTRDGRHLLLANIDSAGSASLWLVAQGEAGRMVAGLRPPASAPRWSGVYGHLAWGDVLDYWPGRPPRRAPASRK